MKIRFATPEDTETINKYDRHISKQELENIIGQDRVFVLEEEKTFIGWLRYNLFWDNTPFMNMIYLVEDYRGKGLGKELVLYWEEEMRRLDYSVVMTSTSSNEYAQHFYYKIGYFTVGGFLPKDEAYEIILEKNL